MSTDIDKRLAELGIVLPEQPPLARANYLPCLQNGQYIYISGQLSELGDEKIKGKLGVECSVDAGYNAARLCAINILSHVKMVVEDNWSRITRIVEVGGFINSAPDFSEHPKVLNGASDLFFEVFGQCGQHTRFAVGVASLPFNFAVEVKAHFEISPL